MVDILLKTGPSIPNVNLTNGDKETSLHCAAQFGHTTVSPILKDIYTYFLSCSISKLVL